MALRRVGSGWEITAARSPGYDRPWARGRASAEDAPPATPQRRDPRICIRGIDATQSALQH